MPRVCCTRGQCPILSLQGASPREEKQSWRKAAAEEAGGREEAGGGGTSSFPGLGARVAGDGRVRVKGSCSLVKRDEGDRRVTLSLFSIFSSSAILLSRRPVAQRTNTSKVYRLFALIQGPALWV